MPGVFSQDSCLSRDVGWTLCLERFSGKAPWFGGATDYAPQLAGDASLDSCLGMAIGWALAARVSGHAP